MLERIRNMFGVKTVRDAKLGVFTRQVLIPFPDTTIGLHAITVHNIHLSVDAITDLTFEAETGAGAFRQIGIKQYIPGRGVGAIGEMWQALASDERLVWSQTGVGNIEIYVEYHVQ